MRIQYPYLFQCVSFILVICYDVANCEKVRFGPCPSVSVQKDFNGLLFNGTWYEILKNPIVVLTNTKCNKMEFQIRGDINFIKASFYQKYFQKNVSLTGKALPTSPEEPAKLSIQISHEFFISSFDAPFWIVHTDYQTAIIWSCIEYVKIAHIEYFWIISRIPNINDDKRDQLIAILNNYGINTSSYIMTDQKQCI